MLGTVEKLAEIFEVTPDVITNWEADSELDEKSGSLVKNYSGGKTAFLKKVKSLILSGHSLQEIKKQMYMEPEGKKQEIPSKNNITGDKTVNLNRKRKNESFEEKINKPPANPITHSEVFSLFTAILQEMREYTDRAIDAEKKVSLLESNDSRAKKAYFGISSEVKQLRIQLEEKEKKLKECEEQKKRLNLMEVQLRIMQIEKNKKSFWEFWKK